MDDPCTRCGSPRDESKWTSGSLRAGLCHTCTFWAEKVEWRDQKDPRAIRFRGVHYYDGGNRPAARDRWSLGFSGAKWHIEMADGRVIETNNLWSQGGIPEDWRTELPDNCLSMEEGT